MLEFEEFHIDNIGDLSQRIQQEIATYRSNDGSQRLESYLQICKDLKLNLPVTVSHTSPILSNFFSLPKSTSSQAYNTQDNVITQPVIIRGEKDCLPLEVNFENEIIQHASIKKQFESLKSETEKEQTEKDVSPKNPINEMNVSVNKERVIYCEGFSYC